MGVNNFKELEKEQVEQFSQIQKEKVKSSIDSSVGMFRFIGDIFELYLPKVVDMFVRMSGGGPNENGLSKKKENHDNPKYPNQLK